MAKKHPVTDALQKAVKGLLYISESEAALEPFLWEDGDKLSEDKLLELAGAEEGTAVETTTLASFLKLVPDEDKPKFAKLETAIKDNLTGVKVYKLGEVEKQVYVVGKTSDGKWAGVKTSVVET